MRRGKRERWSENLDFHHVIEPDLAAIAQGGEFDEHTWPRLFERDAPLVLELGCGQGLFAVDLARRFPECDVVGVDVKGHRFWRGAKRALDESIDNVAFLRARIQWLDRFFPRHSADTIWLTFSDPQVADKRGTKRLSSPYYLRLYQSLLRDGGTVRIKTDSPEFYERTIDDAPAADMEVTLHSANVHGELAEDRDRFDEETARSLGFITAFEERWIRDGRRIHYVELKKVRDVAETVLKDALAMLQGPTDRSRPRRVARRSTKRSPQSAIGTGPSAGSGADPLGGGADA